MNRSDARAEAGILELIRDRLNIHVGDVDEDLIETGLIDSLTLVMLINALEERFACELPLDDFDIDNFRSARRITAYLEAESIIDARSLS